MTDGGLLIANLGWSLEYTGENIVSGHGYVVRKGNGSEAFNFLPGPDGRYFGYLRHQGTIEVDTSIPWTVVFVSKPEGSVGRLRIVGWFENATFCAYDRRPEYDLDPSFPLLNPDTGEQFLYSVTAADAWLVPGNARNEVLPPGHRLKTGGIYFADGRRFDRDSAAQRKARAAMARSVRASLERLRPLAMLDPNSSPDPEPLTDQTLRKRVDDAAMRAAEAHLRAKGYLVDDVSDKPVHYDLHAARGDKILQVEVKGTHRPRPAFFISREEYAIRDRPEWRLAMVTDALGKPVVTLFNLTKLNERFEIKIHSYVAKLRPELSQDTDGQAPSPRRNPHPRRSHAPQRADGGTGGVRAGGRQAADPGGV